MPVRAMSTAIVPATEKASSVPPCAVSVPAIRPPSGAPPMNPKK